MNIMTKCPKCGSELTENDLYRGSCPKCYSLLSDKFVRQQVSNWMKKETEKRQKIERPIQKKKITKQNHIGLNNNLIEFDKVVITKKDKKGNYELDRVSIILLFLFFLFLYLLGCFLEYLSLVMLLRNHK